MGRKPRPSTTRSDLLEAIKELKELAKQPLATNPHLRKSMQRRRKVMQTEIKQLTRAVRRLDESDRKRILKKKMKKR